MWVAMIQSVQVRGLLMEDVVVYMIRVFRGGGGGKGDIPPLLKTLIMYTTTSP